MLTFKGKDSTTSTGSVVDLLNLLHENVCIVFCIDNRI